MAKYDRLFADYQQGAFSADELFSEAVCGARELAADAANTSRLYQNAGQVLDEIDEEFQKSTGLDKADVSFLMLATALQVSRWIVITKINSAVSQKIADSRVEHNDKSVRDMEKQKREAYEERHNGWENKEGKHRNWKNIIYSSVPYDITNGSPKFGVNMEGGYHRIHTLGHDPVLGWVFGTMNILSDTITLEDLRTFTVNMEHGNKHWVAPVPPTYGFFEAYDSIQEDSKRLPAALFAQALHLKSDFFTKNGLPIPVLEAFDPEFAGKIYKEGYDTLLLMKDVAVVGVQAIVAILFNMLIAALHGLFYNPERYPNRNLYEVKTRKILSISNAIASSSNLIWVGGNAWMGNEAAWKDLDIGGIAVTAYRLVTDSKFISSVKKEYLEAEWQKHVVGEEYSFVAEASTLSKKDIKKGIEIQANADAAKQEKVAEGLKQHAAILGSIESRQKDANNALGAILQDKANEEAKSLFGIEAVRDPQELGTLERRALCAAIFTLMDQDGQNNDYQKAFYLNLEEYLGIHDRATDFDFEKLNNIDSNSDRKTILKVICTFLMLGDHEKDFAEDAGRYGWLRAFTSDSDVKNACDEVKRELRILGEEGLVNHFKTLDGTKGEPATLETPDVAFEELPQAADNESVDCYSELRRIIASYIGDEAAFGKQVDSFPASLIKELHKSFPKLSLNTFLFGTKVGNGYLLFTTYAMYLRSGNVLNGEYIRIPYKKIDRQKLATAAGKTKGTRKLLIHYTGDEGESNQISVDDTKITEERLLDLIKEIIDSGCGFAPTDDSLNMPDLPEEELIRYFKALGIILTKENRCLTELYLIVRDYGLDSRWGEISAAFADPDTLIGIISDFKKDIPYPSEPSIIQSAVIQALQTVFRTNTLEKKDVTMLSAETEASVRLFDGGLIGEKQFNDLMKAMATSKRAMTGQIYFDIYERLPEDLPYREQVVSGAKDILETIRKTEKSKKKTLGETIKSASQIIPSASEIKEGAEKAINSTGKLLGGLKGGNANKEAIIIPPEYKRVKQKVPESAGFMKNAVAYAMNTGAASCIVLSCAVPEDAAMPFDNPQWIIDEQHKNMGQNEGLIEVNNGVTASGKPYIYIIVKHRLGENVPGVEYTLNINVRKENSIQFINSSFSEAGMTGLREAACVVMYAQAQNISVEEAAKSWFKDPYDPSYTKGFLMNFSEVAELDERFPKHPLSAARDLVKFIVANN